MKSTEQVLKKANDLNHSAKTKMSTVNNSVFTLERRF